MSVKCANCGEELLGAVNRCWKCGTDFESRPGPIDLPPVRRAPVELVQAAVVKEPSATELDSNTVHESEPLEAELLPEGADQQQQASAETAADEPVETQSSDTGESPVEEPNATGQQVAEKTPQPVRRGSPFAEAGSGSRMSVAPPMAGFTSDQAPQPVATDYRAVEVPQYPKNAAATGGAIASFVLGIMSLLGGLVLIFGAAFSPVGTLLISMLGIVMGIWGIYSARRGIAIAGLLFCCAALAVSSFFVAVELYVKIYDEHPFAAPIDDADLLDRLEAEDSLP